MCGHIIGMNHEKKIIEFLFNKNTLWSPQLLLNIQTLCRTQNLLTNSKQYSDFELLSILTFDV